MICDGSEEEGIENPANEFKRSLLFALIDSLRMEIVTFFNECLIISLYCICLIFIIYIYISDKIIGSEY